MFHVSQLHKNRFLFSVFCVCGCLFLSVLTVFIQKSHYLAGCRQSDFGVFDVPVFAATAQDSETKTAYLTFDDGPSPVTECVLDQLKAEQVPGSFFVIAAPNNERYLPILTRTKEEGHYIALHSCTHEYKEIYQSPEAYWNDLQQLKDKLVPYLGTVEPRCIRFPGGSTNTVSHKYGGSSIMSTLKRQAAERGYHYIDWNVCAEDAVGGHPSSSQIAQTVINDCKGKNTVVILMHDTKNNQATADALPAIIGWLKEQGYTFDTVDHLA